MYYKSNFILLKGENKDRLSITNDFFKDNAYFIEAYLKPKEINIYPNCSSTNVISNGKKKSDVFKMNIMQMIQLLYH